MSRDFNGTTDILTGTIAALTDGDWSMGAWIFPDDEGEAGSGVVIRTETAGVVQQVLQINDVALHIVAIQDYNTTDASSTTSGTLTVGQWALLVATHRGSDNKIRVYLGDLATPIAEMAYTTQTAGVGTFQANGTAAYVGSRSAGTQTFDGRIAHAFVTNAELSIDDMEMFRLGDYSALYRSTTVPNFLLPLETTANRDLARGVAFTATGTAFGEDPPIAAGFLPAAVQEVAHVGAATSGAAQRRARRDGMIRSDAGHRASRW